MIVANSGAIALIDADDRHHGPLRNLFKSDPDAWVLPWAILPEVDNLLSAHVGARAQEAFFADLAWRDFRRRVGEEPDLAMPTASAAGTKG